MSSETPELNISSNEISLKEIIVFLFKNKIPIILITFICTVGAAIYSLYIPPTYQSTSKIITRTSSGSGDGGLSQMAALAGISIGSGKASMDPSKYLTEIIKDREILLKIINHKWYIPGIRDSILLENILVDKVDTSLSNWRYVHETHLVNALRNGNFISLTSNIKSGLLTLVTTFNSPVLAHQLNLFILQLLDDYIRESFKTQAQEKRKFIEERIKEVSAELESSENNLVVFKERNLNTSAPRVFLNEQRLNREVMLNQELYIQLKKQYEIARVEEKNDQPLIEVLQKPEIPITKAGPNRRRNVILGFFLGLITALILTGFIQWFIVTVRK